MCQNSSKLLCDVQDFANSGFVLSLLAQCELREMPLCNHDAKPDEDLQKPSKMRQKPGWAASKCQFAAVGRQISATSAAENDIASGWQSLQGSQNRENLAEFSLGMLCIC
jgi:hypothetical protein